MNPKKILPCGVLVAGSLAAVTGVIFIVMYIVEAIVARLGEPDQSLLFWYLPVLFVGVIGVGTGLRMVTWGNKRLRGLRHQPPPGGSRHDSSG